MTRHIDEYITHNEMQDWLDSDKVWLSDTKFDVLRKSDWIVIESWLADEIKTMVKSWRLAQTSSGIWSNYYLVDTNTWAFGTTKPTLPDEVFMIWRWVDTTWINLFINNQKSKFIDTEISITHNTSYFASQSLQVRWSFTIGTWSYVGSWTNIYISDDGIVRDPITTDRHPQSTGWFSRGCNAIIPAGKYYKIVGNVHSALFTKRDCFIRII
jgi:hypothetical protein